MILITPTLDNHKYNYYETEKGFILKRDKQ